MRITASDIVMDGDQVLREKAVDVELPDGSDHICS